jgi:hypothetical protein
VNWLKKHLAKEFGIEISDRHLKRILKQMGLSTIPKSSTLQTGSNPGKESQSILIHDLKSVNDEESNDFWLFNSSQTE